MNNLMMFEGHTVEVFELKGKVLFNPKHVCKCLDIVDTNDAIRNFNEKQKIKVTNLDMGTTHIRKLNNAGENFITESGVYKLIFKSRKENAEKFQNWVTDEVLPQIRQTGGYIPIKPEESSEEFLARALLVAQATLNKKDKLIEQANNTINEKQTIINVVINDNGLYPVGTIGKILKPYCQCMGNNKVFSFLRDKKVLIDRKGTHNHNLPYDRYCKYFEVKVVEGDYHSYNKTYFNAKGLKWFLDLLVKDNLLSETHKTKIEQEIK